MTSVLTNTLASCALVMLATAAPIALGQPEAPLLISTEERCAFNRVDDESLPLALENCLAAAESGDMQAQFEMGELFHQGERAEQDMDEALKWYEQASVQGHPDAQYRLGLMHMNGEGVPRNLPQAYIILKMASINGQDAAMDASDLLTEQMSDEEIAFATQALGSLFRNYLKHIREEQLNQFNPASDAGTSTP